LHTGLGDNDIDLSLSNPAFLQPLIENYPNVPFVILNSAYPYTREAGYLATVYKHVFLDIGEVFPMISRDGQREILRQALELVPGSKLLYSSDGHWFPETFWLANKQFREVWLEVRQDKAH
jgi:predicted TIM-barrel fold metal-dependent hydrolase